jgi:hypothetical protein
LNIFDFFKKKEEVKQVEEIQPAVVEEVPAVLISQVEQIKPKKPRVKKKKPVPQPKVEPKVDVLKFDFDPANPRLGSIELDWNKEFVELLVTHGYIGNTDEEIVDKWLNDVCKNIASDEFQGANVKPSALSGANLVRKTPLSNGKTEIS